MIDGDGNSDGMVETSPDQRRDEFDMIAGLRVLPMLQDLIGLTDGAPEGTFTAEEVERIKSLLDTLKPLREKMKVELASLVGSEIKSLSPSETGL